MSKTTPDITFLLLYVEEMDKEYMSICFETLQERVLFVYSSLSILKRDEPERQNEKDIVTRTIICCTKQELAAEIHKFLLTIEQQHPPTYWSIVVPELDYSPATVSSILTEAGFPDLDHYRDGSLHEQAIIRLSEPPRPSHKLLSYRLPSTCTSFSRIREEENQPWRNLFHLSYEKPLPLRSYNIL